MEKIFRQLLDKIDINNTPVSDNTPKRAAKAFKFLTSGYQTDLNQIINKAIYPATDHDMVIANNIEFYSLCEHHMLPFFGYCHIAYIPDKSILGISKLYRIVDMYSRRLQLQEQLTAQIATAINNSLQPIGVGIITQASHMCVNMRRIQHQESKITSSTMLGTMKTNQILRHEFMQSVLSNTKQQHLSQIA